MATFQFLHAADIHLDSPLRGLSGQEGSAAERIRGATREAFEQLVTLALAEEVAFVVVAGDLYDGDWRDYRTGLFFAAQMGRLNEAGIPVFLLHGNHDAESQITRRLSLPANVRVFGARAPDTFVLDELGVALHGRSFRHRDTRENLVPGYPDPVDCDLNIGVLHTGLGGMGGHENYAPCALEDLLARGYDYWALGHVHQFQVLHEHPFVVFPGNLQGRHIRETGPKGAVLVTVTDGRLSDLAAVPVDVVRWSRVPVQMDADTEVAGAVSRIRAALEQAVERESDGRLLACRVELRGRSARHGQLVAAEDHLLAEARSIAAGLGVDAAWVERVVVATRPGAGSADQPVRGDALGELQRMLQEAHAAPELLERLGEDPGQMLQRLPHAVRAGIEGDSILGVALGGDQRALIAAVLPHLLARLTAEID
ncbi:exonuclease SbcCD subunit D [Thioalkalivibrio sp.]|uniref:metallophosphoesterase family protein n=1 Tax=Thioalkalivibrio sp. TaxID=2093813 RepID=UPI003561C8B6